MGGLLFGRGRRGSGVGMDKGERESFVLCGLIKGGGEEAESGVWLYICVGRMARFCSFTL